MSPAAGKGDKGQHTKCLRSAQCTENCLMHSMLLVSESNKPHQLGCCSRQYPHSLRSYKPLTLRLVEVYLQCCVDGCCCVVLHVVILAVDYVNRVAAARHIEDLQARAQARRGNTADTHQDDEVVNRVLVSATALSLHTPHNGIGVWCHVLGCGWCPCSFHNFHITLHS